MKTEKNILTAFLLNLAFAIFEILGGFFTGSVAIISDAIHDLGDAISIGISCLLEKKSKKQPDETHTYGYMRYSVLGSVITTLILIQGSAIVIYNAIVRIFNPTQINYDGMLIFAIIGVIVNTCAAYFTKGDDSLNQRAVRLHMLEDSLGWAVVLIGAIVIKFTDLCIIDPLISIGVAIFILINAIKTLGQASDLFLAKAPKNISIEKIRQHLLEIDGITDVHHIHVWIMDSQTSYATMHIVVNTDNHKIKHEVRQALLTHNIVHTTLEIEKENEPCHQKNCHVNPTTSKHCHHHH